MQYTWEDAGESGFVFAVGFT